MFPITLSYIHMPHSGGTKEYSQVLISRADGKTCLVQRWGKAGVYGETKEMVALTGQFQRQFDAKAREKQGRGYRSVETVLGMKVSNRRDLDALRFDHGLPTLNVWAAGLKTADARVFFAELLDVAQDTQSSVTDRFSRPDRSAPRVPRDNQVTVSNELYGAF